MKHQTTIKLLYGVALGALLFLFLITCLNPSPPTFDEVWFMRNMPLFEQYGLSAKFLTDMHGQAPGPLYQIVQSSFRFFTHLHTPGIRLVNVFLFFLVILNTWLCISYVTKAGEHKALLALNLVGVPVVWQVAGMALTEIPAMFFATLSLFILGILTQRKEMKALPSLLWALAGGICLGLSILGRTPFLMIIPAAVILAYNPFTERPNRQRLQPAAFMVFVCSALAVCLPVFYVWKGLVPPQQAFIAQGGLKIWYGVLAFAYAGIISLLLVPQWFTMNRKIAGGLVILLICFFLLNSLWWQFEYQLLSGSFAKVLPQSVLWLYGRLVASVLMVFSVYFLANLLMHMRDHRDDPYYLFLATGVIFLLLTCVNVKHLFSSRYVAQAAPLLILVLIEKDTLKDLKIARLFIGIIIGYISLHGYL